MKLCGSSVFPPLQITCKSCLGLGKISQEWKNVASVHKKYDKHWWQFTVLSPCYLYVVKFLNLIFQDQSGFKQGDSCIIQFLSITLEIYHSMDEGPENRGVFLDILEAFDKIWHQGLLFKLKQNEITDKLLNILEDFLKLYKTRVVLYGQTSN